MLVLDYYRRDLDAIPDSVCDHAGAHTLLVSDNRLTTLPACLERLTSLRTLDAGHNRIVEVPALPAITDFLYLHDNCIESISFERLTRLKYLNLGDNPLAPLTDDVASLRSIEELRLENSGLTSLPEAMGRLTTLVELALRGNRLSSLPSSMRKLDRLTHLDLRGNRFTTLPERLGELNLLKLDLRWNRELELPPWIDALRARGCRVLF